MAKSIAGLGVVLFVLVTAYSLIFTARALASEKGRARAIVLAVFGTTYAENADPWAELKRIIAGKYPGVPVYVGYTSNHVARTLKAKGQDVLTLAEALAKASADGNVEVAVQSLHVVPGEEFEMVRRVTESFTGMPKGIARSAIGAPLIGDAADAARLAEILYANLPAERTADEAVIFVGHGSAGAGGLAYPALQSELWRLDKNLRVGVIEFGPDAQSTARALLGDGIKAAWLCPLLTVTGDHAQNDLFGDEDGSWKYALEKAGITCKPVNTGLARQPGVAAMFAEHLATAFESLDKIENSPGR